jgi:nitroreductase/NAD-dependent dihydropyrimidine dehydrogenase PreA subunit
MTRLKQAPTIDPERCTGCGLCVSACPAYTLSLVKDQAAVTGHKCIGCAHCAAVCPEQAVFLKVTDNEALTLKTVKTSDEWIPFGKYDTGGLVQLMRSRRSCRNFSDKPVDRAVLEDLVRIGITAPSGSNAQPWCFTLLPDRRAVKKLGEETARFLHRLNRLSEKPAARAYARLFLKDALGTYHREYHASVTRILGDWDSGERDRIFNNAPAAIIVSGRKEVPSAGEDAIYASQNILLASHALGLGSCVIGFAAAALQRTPKIRRMIGIPETERVFSVIALGRSRERYQRFAGRKEVTLRYFEGVSRKG